MNFYAITKGIEKLPDGKREEIAIISQYYFLMDAHTPIPKKTWEEIGKLMGWKN